LRDAKRGRQSDGDDLRKEKTFGEKRANEDKPFKKKE